MKPFVIAVDAMGGDHAPYEIVFGAIKALKESEDFGIALVGNEPALQSELDLFRFDPQRLQVIHASEVIQMEESPIVAMRRKQDASILVATQLVKGGQAQALVTAGSSGAAMATATLQLKRLDGIDRPAMAVLFPTSRGLCIILDVGANVDCKPQNLLQFAMLGTVYAKHVFCIDSPRVGLLNIGEERIKGGHSIQQTHALLEDSGLRFTGNIEGWDIPRGKVDVVVCDGFVGNIVIKLAEGIGELVFETLHRSIRREDLSRIKQTFDYTEYGGALLLGIKGTVVITHGRARSQAVASAINMAARCVRSNIIEKCKTNLVQYGLSSTDSPKKGAEAFEPRTNGPIVHEQNN